MRYRTAGEDDVAGLASLRWEYRYREGGAGPAVPKAEFLEACTAFLRAGLRDGTWVYWVAEEDGVIAASSFVKRIRKVPKPSRLVSEVAHLTNVYVRPEVRGRGVGTKLLQRVISWCREQGFELLFVWPSERSVPFYTRQGFARDNDILELVLDRLTDAGPPPATAGARPDV